MPEGFENATGFNFICFNASSSLKITLTPSSGYKILDFTQKS